MEKKSIVRGLRIFIGLTVLTITVLLIFTATEETWVALKKINPIYIPGVLLLIGIYIFLESFRIRFITKAVTGKFIPLGYCSQVVFCGTFLSAVTPFQAGGAPVQAYILKKGEIEWGDALLVLLMRAIFYGLGVLIIIPFILPYFRVSYTDRSMQILSKYAIFVYIFLLGILAFILFHPDPLKRLIYRFTMKDGKRTRATKIVFNIFREIRRMRKGFFKLFREKKLISSGILLFTFLVYIPNFSVAPLILHGLSIDVPYIDTILKQVFLLLAAFFFPTPGAEGIIEGGFAGLFYSSVPRHLLGIFAILWRFFTYHMIVVAGGFLTLKLLNLEKIPQKIKNEMSDK